MAKLSKEEVEHIADLAKLGLTEEEKLKFQEQLSSIIEYADRLQTLDTHDVPPTTSAIPLENVMRGDEIRPSLAVDDALANAPERELDSFSVKAVLE